MNENEPMNKNTPSPSAPDHEEAAVLLTAHALGQLAGSEEQEAQRLLAGPAGAAARHHVAEVRALAAALEVGHSVDLPLRSAELRRAVLAAAARTPAQVDATPFKPARVVTEGRSWNRLGRWLLVGGGVAAVVAGVMVMGVQQGARPVRSVAMATRSGKEQTAADKIDGLASAKADEKQAQPAGRTEFAAASPSPAAASPSPAAASPSLAAPPSANRRLQQKSQLAADRGLAVGAAEGEARKAAESPSRAAADEARVLKITVESAKEHEFSASGEQYDRLEENRFLTPGDQPLSTFSIDVDTASYANVRRFLTSGQLPPRDAVRIEELVNYFRYDYPQPVRDEPFSVSVEASACPWHEGHRLVRIGLQGRDIDRQERPAGNLVFLVDVSGSMGDANKLPLVKQALTLLVEELTENDRVAIVTYAGNAGLAMPSTSGDQKQKIRAAIDALSSGGATHGSAGINLAYEQAAEQFIFGGVNRVILATDGDLNVGVTSDAALVDLIKAKAAGGTFLTVLGFGQGNLQDAKMEKLADNGNGVYAYIDGLREARKVLVEQLTGSTITIAKDVKIQVEFNPAQVASYRLLGYENRILAAADFRNDRKDAGEIGAGHSVTALYEITLVGEGGSLVTGAEPLKYQSQPRPSAAAVVAVDGEASRELLTVKLRWKRPDGDTSTLKEVPLANRGGEFEAASTDMRFAAGVAAFGMILRGSEQRGEATLPFVAKIAGNAVGPDAGGYRAEFLDLVRKAESCPAPR